MGNPQGVATLLDTVTCLVRGGADQRRRIGYERRDRLTCLAPRQRLPPPNHALALALFRGLDAASAGRRASRARLAAVIFAHLGLVAFAPPARGDWYVANSGADYVSASIQDANCGFFTGTIPVGERPSGIAVHPAGTRVYVANAASGTVSVIDAATRSVIATVPTGGGGFQFGGAGVAVHPNGTRVYAFTNTHNSVAVIDTASNTVITRVFVTGVVFGAAVHPDGTRLFVTTAAGLVVVIGTASNAVLATRPVGTFAFGVAFHPDGERAYVATTDGVSAGWITVMEGLTTIATIPVQGSPHGVAVHPNGTRVYVTNDLSQNGISAQGLLTVIDTASNTVIATLQTGRSPYGVAIDRSNIYVTNQLDDNVTVFDNTSHATLGLMDVGPLPTGVATFVPPAPPPLPADVRVTGIEVTQAIQDLDNSVPLVRGRRTFVRAHVASDGPLVFGVTANLFGVRVLCDLGGCDGFVLGSVMPANNVGPRILIQPEPKRTNLNDSFLFELPWAWSDSTSPIRLHVLLHPGPGPAPASCRPDAPSVVAGGFQPETSLDIQFIRMAYDLAGAPPGTPPVETPIKDQNQSESWIRRTYPLSNLRPRPDLRIYDPGLGSRVDRSAQECQDMKADERSLCAQRYVSTLPALLNAVGSANGAYALIPQHPASLFTRGACCNKRLGTGPSQGNVYGYYTAHEIGHLLGRKHPVRGSHCGSTEDDPNYPYPLSLIHPLHPFDPETDLAGFDRGDSGLSLGRMYVGNFSAFDVMGYCGPVYWISDYTYNNLYGALRRGAVSVLQSTGPSGGATAGASSEAALQIGDWLMVLGQISPDPAAPGYIQTRRVDRIEEVPPRTPGSHSIRLVGVGGVSLAEYPFTPEPLSDAEEVAGAPTLNFAHVVPFVAGTEEIQIVDVSAGNRVVAAKAVSPNPPVVQNVMLQGPDPSTGTAAISWAASDLDGDSLTFDVSYTRDGGASLQPLMLNLPGTSAQIDASALGGGTVLFRVLATDGVNSAFADTPSFTLADKPPRPRILDPGEGATIYEGQLVNLEGAATDPQDGVIPDGGLVWSVEGRRLGSGARLSVTDLPIGTNEIVLTATHSLGLSDTATVRVNVREAVNPPGPTLTAGPGQIGWHVAEGESQVQTAELHVGNSGSGDLGFTAESSAPWLTVLPDAGVAPATLTLSADPRGFEGGMRGEAQVTLTADGPPDQVVTIPVTLSMGNTFLHGARPFEGVPSCVVDVSAQVSVTRGGFRRNYATGRFVQQVTLKNTGSRDLSEVSLVLDNLSGNATLHNKSGDTACAAPVSPYVNVNAGADRVLSSGESVTVVLEFANPSNRAITYDTRVVGGSGNR